MSEPLYIATAKVVPCPPYHTTVNRHHASSHELVITCDVAGQHFEVRGVTREDAMCSLRLARMMHEAGVPDGQFLAHQPYWYQPDPLKHSTDWGLISEMARVSKMPVLTVPRHWRPRPPEEMGARGG